MGWKHEGSTCVIKASNWLFLIKHLALYQMFYLFIMLCMVVKLYSRCHRAVADWTMVTFSSIDRENFQKTIHDTICLLLCGSSIPLCSDSPCMSHRKWVKGCRNLVERMNGGCVWFAKIRSIVFEYNKTLYVSITHIMVLYCMLWYPIVCCIKAELVHQHDSPYILLLKK